MMVLGVLFELLRECPSCICAYAHTDDGLGRAGRGRQSKSQPMSESRGGYGKLGLAVSARGGLRFDGKGWILLEQYRAHLERVIGVFVGTRLVVKFNESLGVPLDERLERYRLLYLD